MNLRRAGAPLVHVVAPCANAHSYDALLPGAFSVVLIVPFGSSYQPRLWKSASSNLSSKRIVPPPGMLELPPVPPVPAVPAVPPVPPLPELPAEPPVDDPPADVPLEPPDDVPPEPPVDVPPEPPVDVPPEPPVDVPAEPPVDVPAVPPESSSSLQETSAIPRTSIPSTAFIES
ncbi:MAG: hypothetical protein CVU63_04215 [Deltaproteobacteria bacterium HGW-Deltaproteobacteria-20]|nr:MAG: hypothetical protein CVU63_04215 [Deltaproteobacteria bacterium HGW-Deltaproteobacteria-20]